MRKPPKRFYKEAGVGGEAGAFTVLLDGRTVKTPKGTTLTLPTEALAAAVAEEWGMVGEGEGGVGAAGARIVPSEMPMMTLATIANDQADELRGEMQETVYEYLEGDLILFRQDFDRNDRAEAAYYTALADEETAKWDPLVDWFATEFNVPRYVDALASHAPRAIH